MGNEGFWDPKRTEGDPPDLTVRWGEEDLQVGQIMVNDVEFDRSGINRLIKTLRQARDQVYGSDE